MDFNDYVGLPYIRGGRDRAGIDCWGLVRLVHAERFGNDLPSFDGTYDIATERDRLAELIAQQKEAWQPVADPRPGDVVVLRVEGAESHLGLVVEPGRMLHALAGSGSVIEPYASAKWVHRVSGFFRYMPGAAPVTISAKPHPLRSTRIDDTLPHGATVQAMVDHYTRACGWPSDVPVRGVAFIDGLPVSQEEWGACVPAPGSCVEFRVVAGDGDAGRIIAMIAIAVFAWWAAPFIVTAAVGINGAAALGTAGLTAVTAATAGVINVVGGMLVNAIFPIRPPESGGMTEMKPAWALSGGQNQMAPYGAIPVVLGQYRFTGLLGTTPWLEQGGDETYLRQTVVWGYGPLSVSDIKVGTTPISSLEEVQIETTTGAADPSDDFWRLAGSDTSYQSINVKLENPSWPTATEADWIERRTQADTDTIAVLLSWPQGLAAIDDEGKRGGWYSVVEVQIRAVGAPSWTALEGAFYNGEYRDPFNKQLTYNVARGQYDVRCRVTSETVNIYGGTFLATVMLVGIRSHKHQRPIAPPKPLAMTAIRVRASNQINGQLEGVSALVQSICLDWTGSAWISRATRNPASLYRYVLQHPANARAITDSSIDLAALQDWHAWCAARGLIFDHVLTGRRPLLDVLRDICAAGRASPAMIDGKWTVTIDREKPTIAQHFTPHNSWGFEGARLLPKVPHALRVTFVNAGVDYQPDERIVYDDGYSEANAIEIESIELPGVSDSGAVYKLARHHLAQIKLRPEEYALHADIEHVVCNRGDRVRVTHDVPMWGLGSGRIKTFVDGTHVEIDEAVPMDAGVQYTVRIRLESGASITRTVSAVAEDGYYSALTLTSSITATEGKPGNLCMFGSLNSESVDCLVKSIEPAENHSARLILVDYAPGVFTADTEPIPPWSSQITQLPLLARRGVSAIPTITDVISDERALVKVGPRTFQPQIKVSWAQPTDLVQAGLYVETQIRRTDRIEITGEVITAEPDDSPWVSRGTSPLGAGGTLIGEVVELARYELRCRYVSDEGRTGGWSDVIAHSVIGKTTPPPPVYRFKVIEQPGGIKQYLWQIDEPPNDLLAFEIAYSFGTIERPWSQMIPLAAKDPLARTHETNEPINDGAYTFAIRVVDAGELASAPVYYTEVLDGDQFGSPVAVIVPHELDWPGTKTNCGIEGTSLVNDGGLTWSDFDVAWSATESGWASSVAQTISYEHSVIDMGAVAAWVIRANALVGGSLTIEISTSDDGVTYSAWGAVPSASVTTRYIKYRVSVFGVDPIIYRAQIIIYGA